MDSWLMVILIVIILVGFVVLRWTKRSGVMSKTRFRLPGMVSGNVDTLKKQTELETTRSEKLKAILDAKRELMRVKAVNDGISKQIAEMTKDNVDKVEPPAPVVKKRQMLD